MIQVRNRIKEYLDDVISIKWLAVAVVFYFYSVMLKKEIVSAAYEMKTSFNSWDITLRLLNDMYLIVYFVIPVVFFLSIKTILVDFDYQMLIRIGSFKKWVYHSLKHFWLKSAPFLLLWVFVSLFMMIGFPYSWNWSLLSQSDHITNSLNNLVTFFGTPFSAFSAQLILLVLTLTFFHIVLAALYVVTKSINTILLFSVLVFIGSIIGFKILPKEIAFLAPPTYFSINKIVNTFDSIILSFIVVIVLGIFIILCLQILDINKKNRIQLIKPYIPIGFYFTLCIFGMVSTANSLKNTDATIWDVWLMSFRGSSSENFSYIPFFYYMIVFFGFIYLVQLFLSNEVDKLGYYKIIRFRNITRWFWSWMKGLLIAVALFLFTLLVFSLVIGMGFGMNIRLYLTILPNPLFEVIYHFFINGFLQIVFYIFVAFIVSWIGKESLHGVMLISLFMVLMLPGVNTTGIIPVGLNSIVYLTNFSPYYLTAILVLTNVVAFIVVTYLFRRSLII